MKNFEPSKKLSRSSFLRAFALGLPLLPVAALNARAAEPDEATPEIDLGNLRAFVELARSDIRTNKALIIAQNIDFTSDEAVEFWPVQREYETDLNKLLDQRYDLIVKFAKQYGSMTDPQAADLAMKVFDLEGKRTDLKRKYFKKFRKVIPALKAARFFQIENQINMAIDLQVAASLPLIK
jgi:hypothetical protein